MSRSGQPTDTAIDRCARVIAGGGVAVVPTDTLYGLAASIVNPEAVARVAAIKGRALGTGMPVLLASSEQVAIVGADAPYLQELGAAFWPGGVTLVIPARPEIDPRITDARRTVAVRVPGMAVTREVCRRAGAPITGTSANRHRDPPPTTAAEARAALGDSVDDVLDDVLDGGPVGGTASTIVDLTGNRPRILRPGAVSWDALRRIAPTIIDAPGG
ncbi:MAG: L-threonylcarbamoyladenylate synthase [Chloroflexota bacterium]|nr:L-threonylcarbamoyladenylate synthase [Chloroflexota bacterium]